MLGSPSVNVVPMYSKTSSAIGPETIRTLSPVAKVVGVSCEPWLATVEASCGFQPMKLRATAMPIATPTPTLFPNAAETATAPTVASIFEVLSALISTAPTAAPTTPSELFSTKAFVFVRMMFVDSAPPPLTATAFELPIAMATAAATE